MLTFADNYYKKLIEANKNFVYNIGHRGDFKIMFTNEMYKIEKIIHEYKMSGITDIKELVELRKCHKFSSSGGWYYYSAAIIPYTEMLKHINEYNNRDMEETTEMRWWDSITEKYNKYNGHYISPLLFNVYDAIYRFKCVERLSKSLIYRKKLEKLYGLGENVNAKSNKKTRKLQLIKKQE